MYVAPSQLIPGCVLLEAVKGKSSRAIIPENTVLTETHITVLEKFLVQSVHVSPKLNDGKAFRPANILAIETERHAVTVDNEKKESLLFIDHYRDVVAGYKKEFNKWQNGWKVDMPAIRRLVVPLLERVTELGGSIYMLHQYTSKKDYLYDHAVAVGMLSAYLGKKMGYDKGEWLQIGLAGLLSDCGMAKLDRSILTKTGSLTDTELEEIKKHPTYSYQFVEHVRTITTQVKLAVIQHHERMDGSGYPLGISKDKIHLYARIIAVCDTFHAMASKRTYKVKQPPFKVIGEMLKSQFLIFDPQVIHPFIKGFSDFMIGARVRLSNDQIGEVVFIDSDKPNKPMIKTLDNAEIFTLGTTTELSVDEIIS